MNEQMDCLRYREHLDEWIDGMLDDDMAAAMQAHADCCPDCAAEARLAREMLEMVHTLDNDIPVPLQAQAAWRSAVRAEAAQVRRAAPKKRFSAAIRAIGSVAAACVVLAGCTGVFRMTGMLDFADAPAAVMTAHTGDEPSVAYFAARSVQPASGPLSRTADVTYIASDGAVTENAPMQRSVPMAENQAVIPLPTQQPLLIRSVERTILTENFDSVSQNIRDLTEQYGGYLADDAVSTAAGLRTGEFTAVVPAVEADSFLQTIDLLGNVTYSADHQKDVSPSVLDVQTRLDALTAEQQRLNEMIAAATDADELARLSLQMEVTLNKLDAVQTESNTLKREMESVRISIRLEEHLSSASAAPTSDPALGRRMSAAFSQSADTLQSFVHDMAVSLMIMAPVLIGAAVIAIIVIAAVLIIRHRR